MKPILPALDFSLRLRTGYKISIPLSQFRGTGHGWSTLLRVTPSSGDPVYLATTSHLPEVTESRADGEVTGSFVVGEGGYDIAVIVKDDQHRICRGGWHLDAKLANTERSLKSLMPENSVAETFGVPRLERPDAPAMRSLTVLLHALPVKQRTAEAEEDENAMLPVMLAALLQQLPARQIHLVLFNLEQQRVLLRNDNFTRENFDAVSKAIGELQLAKVDYSVLKNRTGAVDLLTGLVDTELRREHPADAVIFLGPHSRIADPIPAQALEHAPSATEFFYLHYALFELRAVPVQPFGLGRRGRFGGGGMDQRRASSADNGHIGADSIEQLMKRLKGHTITLGRPHDFAAAIAQVSQRTTQH